MAGEAVGLNIPTFQNNAASVTERNGEYAGTPFDDINGDGSYNTYLGCNRAGANAPGIGIGTGFVLAETADDLSPEKWTLLDQDGAARTPQNSQHIGGDGLGVGDESVNPINGIVDQHGVPDFNDDMFMQEVLAQAAPGIGIGIANADPINRTNRTVEIGEVIWATDTNV